MRLYSSTMYIISVHKLKDGLIFKLMRFAGFYFGINSSDRLARHQIQIKKNHIRNTWLMFQLKPSSKPTIF